MKKSFVAAALTTALVASSMPAASYAADTKVPGKEYIVVGNQECESLRQILKNIFVNFDGGNLFCPTVPNEPETETPEQPDTQEPIIPENPDTQEPIIPEQPEIQEPTVPEQPEIQEPTTPEQPDTQEPDNENVEETVHPYVIEVLNLVNNEREKAGLPSLQLDTDITSAANVRAKEITQSFSHTRPNGSSFSTVLKEHGVTFSGSGENIAWGQTSPKQVMNAWMNSDGHRANILNKNFKNIGIGYYQDGNGRNHWVQLFTF